VERALEHARAHGKTLKEYTEPGLKKISAGEFWALPVDILFPAAMENQINEGNAKSLKAGIILEGANGPTTVEADAILNAKGVEIIPDILANAGGVVVSYFEWVQNLEAFTWEEDEVNHKLAQIMEKAFAEVWRISREKKVPLRMAAYMVALDRVVKARKLRGIFP
jgi:glutamate dehydrogenase/leucine dehydrogenase